MGANRYDGIDEYAVRQIATKAAALVGVAGFRGYDYQDLQQELAIQLVQKLRQFDAKRGSLRAFVNVVVKTKSLNIIEAQTMDKRDYRRCVGSTNDLITNNNGEQSERMERFDTESSMYSLYRTPNRTCEERRDLACDLHTATSQWPPRLGRLCQALMATDTMADARRLTNTPRGALERQLREARDRLEQAGLESYVQEASKTTRHGVARNHLKDATTTSEGIRRFAASRRERPNEEVFNE